VYQFDSGDAGTVPDPASRQIHRVLGQRQRHLS
jgi:hypothetical protein